MRARRKVTIKDVARALRVSITTVSRALRDRPGISDVQRSRVKRVASKMGYVPNPAGAALSIGRMSSIAFVLPQTDGRFPSLLEMEVLRGLTDELAGSGYNVTLLSEKYLRQRGLTVFDSHKVIHADAFVLVLVKTEHTRTKESFPVPVVIVNREIPGFKGDFVVSDDEHGAYLAARHLIDLGHKSIAQITGPSDNYNLVRRLSGVESALSEAQLPMNKALIAEASSITREGGQSAMLAILNTGIDFSAVFCGSDILAVGALETLRARNIKVPSEISVASFDDDSFAEFVDPPLTTIRKPRYRMGREAGQLLKLRIAGNQQKASATKGVSTELVKRRSTGPYIKINNTD